MLKFTTWIPSPSLLIAVGLSALLWGACGADPVDDALELQEQAIVALETHKDAPKQAGEALETLAVERSGAIGELTELKKSFRKNPASALQYAERHGARAIAIKDRELTLRKSHPELFNDPTVKRLWPKFE